MSDVMLFGVLRMPYEMAMEGEISRRQFYSRAQEAADRLEAAERQLIARTTTTDAAREVDALPDDAWEREAEKAGLIVNGLSVSGARTNAFFKGFQAGCAHAALATKSTATTDAATRPQSAAEVDVEAERKLYLDQFPAYMPGYWTAAQERDFAVWLAARRTQADAGKEITPEMLQSAVKAAVAAGIIPKSGGTDQYLKCWDGIKAVLEAALCARV